MKPDIQKLEYSSAFTLTELLFVIAIMGVISAFSVPAFNSIAKSSALASTNRIVVDHLNLARQTALSRNASVEVRFYKLADYNQPATSGPTVYRALQLFIQDNNSAKPFDNPIYFRAPIICIDNSMASTLLDVTEESTPSFQDPSLGIFERNYLYRSFRFKPSGSTDLPDHVSMHLSFKIQTDPDIKPGLPRNFATVQIDPATGRVRTFRP